MEFRPRLPAEGNLTGIWRATPATFELKRTGADDDLDDSSWQPLEVPGHWGEDGSLSDHDGPILYRKRFQHRPPEAEERLWLRFDGVLTGAEIWLDGSYIGDTTSYFAPSRFDITDHLARTDEHLLAVEVSCPDQSESRTKSSITGSLQTGHLAPAGNPGGIWRDVVIDSTGPVAIKYSRLLCVEADEDSAEIHIRLVLDAKAGADIRIDTSVLGPDGVSAGGGGQRHSLASGENRIEWSIPIDKPELWWPAALGGQPLYEVAVAVRLADGRLSDRRDWRTGLRDIELDDFIWRVNGQRLFAKGIAYGPTERFLNSTSVADLAKDVASVRDAGLDLLRIYGHIGRPELYTEADRQGLLIWQDLPLVGGYSSKVRLAARRMSRAAVDRLSHHPSVGLWCGHCHPNGQTVPPDDRHTRAASIRRLGRHLLPSWNRSILDPIVRRELRNADRTRPIVLQSGALPGPADPGGSDANIWLGWHAGRPEDLPRLLRNWPQLGAFLGGIGSQSVAMKDWDEQEPTWAGAEQPAFARYLPRKAYSDGLSWAAATRAYQADLLRLHIETLRRLKYRPSGGFCLAALLDADPAGGFGIFDSDRTPKPAHNVVIDACRPVVVVADPPPALTVPDQPVSLAVHVISDLREPLGSVRVTARAHIEPSDDQEIDTWSHTSTWEGSVDADSCQWVGDFSFTAPPGIGKVLIDLEMESTERLATNRYRTVVIPLSESIPSPRSPRRPGVG